MAIPVIDGLVKLGGTWLEGKVAKTKAKAEAEATVMVKQAESVADWETAMARASQQSWKDEWLTLLFSVPLVLCFFPATVEYLEAPNSPNALPISLSVRASRVLALVI